MTAPRTTPRPRWPPTSCVTLEAAAEQIAAGTGPDPRAARAAGPRDGRELGRAGPRARAHRDRSPAATRQRWPRNARRWPSARRSCSTCSTRCRSDPVPGRRLGRWRHEDGHHRGRPARGARRRARGRPAHRPGPDDGRVSRRPPLADRSAPAPTATSSSSRCSSIPPSSTTPATSPPIPARTSATRERRRGSRRRHPLRARRRRGLPGRLRHHGAARWHHRAAGGRQSRPRALHRRDHGRRQAVRDGRARRRLLRPEGRPAGRRRAPRGRRSQPGRRRSSSAPRSATTTASLCPAATRASRRPSGERALSLSRALP